MSKTLVLGATALALSAGAASVRGVYVTVYSLLRYVAGFGERCNLARARSTCPSIL